MMRGVQWHFYGVPVANPGKEELLRWVPATFRQALSPPEMGNQGDPKKANATGVAANRAGDFSQAPTSWRFTARTETRAGMLRPHCELTLPRATEPLLR